MEEESQVDVTPGESVGEKAILERASDGIEEVAGNMELDLPDALQDLLRRLSGDLRSDEDPVTEVPYLGRSGYGGFFWGKEESGTLSEVRLKFFEAVGKCKTLREFDNSNLLNLKLSVKEWEAILIPMQNNLQLEKITWYCNALHIEEIQSLLLDLFAHAQNLACLGIHRLGEGGSRWSMTAISSGLRVNAHPRLKELYVDCSGLDACDDKAILVSHIADIISSAPELSRLQLYDICRIDGITKEALTTALKGSFNLSCLTFSWVTEVEGIVDVLAEVYGRPCSRPFVECPSGGEEPSGDVLATLMGKWQSAGRGLLQPLTLSTLQIEFRLEKMLKEELQVIERGLAQLWKESKKSRILDISAVTCFSFDEGNSFASEEQLIFLENALKDTYLKMISICNSDVSLISFQSCIENLAFNTSVRGVLMFSCGRSSKDGWTPFFRALRRNTSITTLVMQNCDDLNNDNFRELMDTLQINFTLQEVSFRRSGWDEDGKDALVQEVLQRNKKLAGYFSIMGEANLEFGKAKAGRIFMCGAPFAGKSQLKVTMMKTLKKESKSESVMSTIKKVTKLVLVRTKGIEVELLCKDEYVTISIWDFAGDEIFRALQNILFPRINQSCIFVFVFNPYKEIGKELKDDINSAFVREFKSWLRFLVSNTRITGRILPQVFIVVTHIDKLKKNKLKMDPTLFLQPLEGIVKKFQDKFKYRVDISPKGSGHSNRLIHYVNAKDTKDVQPFTDLVISSMKYLLEQKSSKVPTVCSELASTLLEGPKEIQHEPLWLCDRFYNFCSSSSLPLENFKLTDEKGKGVLRAVASYLHDAGAICMTPSTLVDAEENPIDNLKKLIVVNLNWLTQNFVGQLISIGQNSELTDAVCTSQHSRLRIDQEGFINHEQLLVLIERILQKDYRRKKVDHGMVIELLLELDLCYCLESDDGIKKYFMPIVFSGGRGALSSLCWRTEPPEGSDHFGYRVQCANKETTSFSPALFPRYQIHLRKEMEVNNEVIDENFIFSLSHVEIREGGLWILVEIDESTENHIDILVRFSKRRTRDWAMNFVQKHIVKSFIEFCASEKGCPGMEVVVAVLRTDCVRELTPRELREECQSILLEELKKKLQREIEDQLQDVKADKELMFDHIHHWPEIKAGHNPQFSLPSRAEQAQTLLSSGEVNDVVTSVHKNHEELWRNLEGLRAISNRLDHAHREDPCSLPSPTGEEHSSWGEFSFKREHRTQFLGPLVSRQSFQKREDVSAEGKLILRGIHEVQENVQEVRENLHEMQENINANFAQLREDMRHLKLSMKEVQSLMSKVNSTVDSIIGFKISEERHRYPRRLYFSPDVSLQQKVKAKFLIARPVRLHFMCEARHRFHFVKDQPGLELLLKKEGRFPDWMRTLSVISIHMIWIFLKIGAQVTAGIGSAFPEISSLTKISVGASAATVNVVLDELRAEVKKNVNLIRNERSVEEAWCSFRNYLEPLLTFGECARLFSLHLVRYKNSDDPYAWLCEGCISNARRNFWLE